MRSRIETGSRSDNRNLAKLRTMLGWSRAQLARVMNASDRAIVTTTMPEQIPGTWRPNFDTVEDTPRKPVKPVEPKESVEPAPKPIPNTSVRHFFPRQHFLLLTRSRQLGTIILAYALKWE
jgi:hypothetical protein